MGLDMYLYKETYVKQWNFTPKEKQYNVTVTQGGEPVDHIKSDRIAEIKEEVGYWRKANQIHKWFVDNVQNGEDDCGNYYVSNEQLKELLEICKKVKENHKLAEELLPSSSGFFFGQTEYNERYFQDIDNTIEIIEQLLTELQDENNYVDIYYSSSW